MITRVTFDCMFLKNFASLQLIRKFAMVLEHSRSSDFFFRQLFDKESSTYTYLLADVKTKEAVIIDPVLEQVERDAKIISELDFNLLYSMNTHMHADHITGTGLLKHLIPDSQTMISKASGAKADILLDPGDSISFGNHSLEARPTPGHTSGCMTFICYEQGVAFTGDTLLIRGCGRTDFQEGNPETLYKSVYNEIFTLPDNFQLYPAHDYKGQTVTTVWEEKKYNPRLTKTIEEFVVIMNNLNLPYPKKMAQFNLLTSDLSNVLFSINNNTFSVDDSMVYQDYTPTEDRTDVYCEQNYTEAAVKNSTFTPANTTSTTISEILTYTNTSTCVFKYMNKNRTEIHQHNLSCKSSEDCNDPTMTCSLDTRECRCAPYHVWNRDRCRCVPNIPEIMNMLGQYGTDDDIYKPDTVVELRKWIDYKTHQSSGFIGYLKVTWPIILSVVLLVMLYVVIYIM